MTIVVLVILGCLAIYAGFRAREHARAARGLRYAAELELRRDYGSATFVAYVTRERVQWARRWPFAGLRPPRLPPEDRSAWTFD